MQGIIFNECLCIQLFSFTQFTQYQAQANHMKTFQKLNSTLYHRHLYRLIKNNSGPKIDPCGTPVIIIAISD